MIGVADENAERYRYHRGDPDRRHGIGQVLKQQVPNAARALQLAGSDRYSKRFMPALPEPGQRSTLNEQDQGVKDQ